jgi:hypothetical protein
MSWGGSSPATSCPDPTRRIGSFYLIRRRFELTTTYSNPLYCLFSVDCSLLSVGMPVATSLRGGALDENQPFLGRNRRDRNVYRVCIGPVDCDPSLRNRRSHGTQRCCPSRRSLKHPAKCGAIRSCQTTAGSLRRNGDVYPLRRQAFREVGKDGYGLHNYLCAWRINVLFGRWRPVLPADRRLERVEATCGTAHQSPGRDAWGHNHGFIVCGRELRRPPACASLESANILDPVMTRVLSPPSQRERASQQAAVLRPRLRELESPA